MCPPATSLHTNIGFDGTQMELFMLLEDIGRGCTLPSNVIDYVNPCDHLPSNLPEDMWYLTSSSWNGDTKFGIWKAKGEACELFSNSAITGWRNTHEFFEGKVPHQYKTDWVMEEYWITLNGLDESSKAKEANALCRVFLSDENGRVHERGQQMAGPLIANETKSNSTQSALLVTRNDIGNSLGRNIEVDKGDETKSSAVAGTPVNYQMGDFPELGYFHEGNYLELFDLETPASSPDNSSCKTMSSDEYFDYVALLRDLESESNRDLVQKDEDCKFSVSTSLIPDEMVMLPPSPGASISIEESRPAAEEIPRTEPSMSCLSKGDTSLNRRVSSSHDEGTPSSSHTRSREKKANKSRMKKMNMKYLCFMPF